MKAEVTLGENDHHTHTVRLKSMGMNPNDRCSHLLRGVLAASPQERLIVESFDIAVAKIDEQMLSQRLLQFVDLRPSLGKARIL